MKLNDSVELAARNLRESVLRNSLTTLGIAVGVASLVAMLSLGVGLQRMASRRLKSSGLFDTVLVTSRRDMRAFNREQEMNGPSPAESPDLDDAARRKIENIALMLRGAMAAQGNVGLMMNVRRADLDKVLGILPALQNPTISSLSDANWVDVNTIVDERIVRDIVPKLKEAGACGIVEYPLNKIID